MYRAHVKPWRSASWKPADKHLPYEEQKGLRPEKNEVREASVDNNNNTEKAAVAQA